MNKLLMGKFGLVGLALCLSMTAIAQEGLGDAQRMCRDMTDGKSLHGQSRRL